MSGRCASALAGAFVLCVASSSAAQAARGAIAGHVDDANAAPVAGVTVRIRCASFDREAVTSADGNYVATGVPTGVCVVIFEVPGFKTNTQRGRVADRRTTTVSATLVLASPGEPSPRYLFLPADASFAYSVARDSTNLVSFPAGSIAGGSVGVTSWLNAVADVSANYKREDLLESNARFSVYSATAGLRAGALVGRLYEFAQLTTGVVRASGTAFGVTDTRYSLVVQPGFGVDYPISHTLALRAQFDVRLIRSGPEGNEGGRQYRFGLGIVYRKLYIFI